MKNWKVQAAVALVVISTMAGFGFQQAKKAPEKAAAMDEKAMMDMMEKLATPGAEHKKLDFFTGTWNAKTTMWMDPSKPPEVSQGTSEQKWVLGGRFQEQRIEGTMMNMPFLGLGYTGYDNYKKQYVLTWMDTMGTCILNMAGNFDPSGKVFTATGKMDDPVQRKPVTYREKTTIVSKDEVLFEMFGPAPDGKDYRMMEVRYTRKK